MTSTEMQHIFEKAKEYQFGNFHIHFDPPTGLVAIIAIHNTNLGPALGGCRFKEYADPESAFQDAMRLARGMTFKAAMADLPYGGGKSVIMKPAMIRDRDQLFQAFGKFVESLNGRYITAMDLGVSLDDMVSISKQTRYNASYQPDNMEKADPAPYTAYGVLQGIKAAVKFKLKKDSLSGLHIAIQGAGHVGKNLVELLHAENARITIADVNEQALKAIQEKYPVTIVSTDEIYSVPCDVFSPCALGSSINSETVPLLNTTIIAGAANNQLKHHEISHVLKNKNILWAPDYVINAGGLIFATCLYENHVDEQKIRDRVGKLYNTLMEVFTLADAENRTPQEVADQLAEARVNKGKKA